MTSAEVQVEHLESEKSHEYVLSVYFASLIALLMIAIVVSNYVSHKWHLQWLPEAAGACLRVLSCVSRVEGLPESKTNLECLSLDDLDA